MTQYIPPAVYSILEVINRIITLSGSFPNLNPKWSIQADSNNIKRLAHRFEEENLNLGGHFHLEYTLFFYKKSRKKDNYNKLTFDQLEITHFISK